MRVMIMGGDGMLGHKAFQVLSQRFETFATFRHPNGLWKNYPMYARVEPDRTIGGVEATNFQGTADIVRRVMPDVLINCIGLIKQLKEARDAVLSIEVNSLFPHQLAKLCAGMGTRLIHISTDCVFSGCRGNYNESDIPDPCDLYGRSKLLGEMDQPGCLTIRTSVIGRDFQRKSQLLEWFLSNRGGRIRGFARAIYTGFTTLALARIFAGIIEKHPDISGIYHVASKPISKYDLLVKIRDAMRLDIEIEMDTDFVCDRSLNASRFIAKTGYSIPDWESMISELVQDDTPYDEWRTRNETA